MISFIISHPLFKNITNKDQRAHRALDELDKIYSYDELMNILDLAKEIDDDEKYTYDLIDNSCGVKKSNETNNDSDEIAGWVVVEDGVEGDYLMYTSAELLEKFKK